MYGQEYVSDPKIHSLTADERSCWLTLLCYASISNVEGEVMNMTEEKLKVLSGVDMGAPQISILEKLDILGMIKLRPDGTILIVNWNKRQEKDAMSGYERIKRYRERKKNTEQIGAIAQTRFEEFWSAYPRKVSKQSSQRAWEKINPDDSLHKVMLSAIAEQSKSPQWTKDDGQYIPHPATWLNQKRWNDELKVKVPGPFGGKYDHLK